MHSNATKGYLQISIISKRLVSIAASTVPLNLVSASANAQFDVFNAVHVLEYGVNGTSISTYKVNTSMILNRFDVGTAPLEGSVPTLASNLILSYQVGNGAYQTVDNSFLGAVDAKGYQRMYLGELNVTANTEVRVRIQGNHAIAENFCVNSASNVSYLGSGPSIGNATRFTNSNLRVYNPDSTNPGASVAPEPGSFALALTGGAALLGICVRRRRNAA